MSAPPPEDRRDEAVHTTPTVDINVGTNDESRDEFLDELDGRSPVLRAVRRNDIATLKAILAEHPDAIEDRGHMGRRALHIAADSGNAELVRFLISANADVNARRDERMDTPVFRAATPKVASLLLDAGADFRSKDFAQRTALHWSAQFARPEMVSFWLKHGLLPNDRDDSEMTPLHWAVIEITEPASLDCVRFLIDAGADVNAKADLGQVPLHSVARLPDLQQRLFDGSLKYKPGVREARLEILRLLLAHGANPLIAHETGVSPLKSSAGEPREIIEKWLIDHPTPHAR